jgi:Helicase HerA-like C-terminal
MDRLGYLKSKVVEGRVKLVKNKGGTGMPEALPIAKGSGVCCLLPRMANRHGLIAGATGTGREAEQAAR